MMGSISLPHTLCVTRNGTHAFRAAQSSAQPPNTSSTPLHQPVPFSSLPLFLHPRASMDETNKNECKAPAPLSPSSFSIHDRSRQQDQAPGGRPDPDTPYSLAEDDFDVEGPSSSPPSHVPSLGSSYADEAKGRGKHQTEIRRAFDLIQGT
jgi:hypothetical protein